MGFFMVDVKTENQPWHEVFRRAGNQGNHWHEGFVELSVSFFLCLTFSFPSSFSFPCNIQVSIFKFLLLYIRNKATQLTLSAIIGLMH